MFRLGSGSGRLSVVSISQLPDSRDQTSPEAHPSMRRTHEGHSSARGLAISGGAHDMSNPPPAESGFRPVHNGYHANRNTWMSLLSLLAFDTRDGRLNDNYGLELIDLENLGHQTMLISERLSKPDGLREESLRATSSSYQVSSLSLEVWHRHYGDPQIAATSLEVSR